MENKENSETLIVVTKRGQWPLIVAEQESRKRKVLEYPKEMRMTLTQGTAAYLGLFSTRKRVRKSELSLFSFALILFYPSHSHENDRYSTRIVLLLPRTFLIMPERSCRYMILAQMIDHSSGKKHQRRVYPLAASAGSTVSRLSMWPSTQPSEVVNDWISIQPLL